jgi:hypothetical protein
VLQDLSSQHFFLLNYFFSVTAGKYSYIQVFN